MIDIKRLGFLAQAQPVKEWKSYYRDQSMYAKKPMYGVQGPGGVSDHEDWGFTRVAASYIAAASPAVMIELLEEIQRLRGIETFEDAVACVFDNLKYSAANTDDKAWDERLEDFAEDVIEYAPRYKKQWKDIVKLSREKDDLKAENEALRKDADRYRWLRDECVDGRKNEHLDCWIDQSMAQEQQP